MTFDDALTVVNTILFDRNYWIVEREHFLEMRNLPEWYHRIPPGNIAASAWTRQIGSFSVNHRGPTAPHTRPARSDGFSPATLNRSAIPARRRR